MKLMHIFTIILLFILTGCTLTAQTPVSEETAFVGESENWSASYIFDPKLYKEKHYNWLEIEYTGDDVLPFDLQDIDMEFKSSEGILSGNLGDMKTKVNQNNISILVGTINQETYKDDEYELILKTKDTKEVIALKLRD